MQYSNYTACCLLGVELRLTFQLYIDGVESPWPVSAVLSDVRLTVGGRETVGVPEISGPVYRFYFDSLGSAQSAMVRGRLSLTCLAGYSVRLYATCHTTLQAGEDCAEADATVPLAVTDLWDAAGVPTLDALAYVTRAAPFQVGA